MVEKRAVVPEKAEALVVALVDRPAVREPKWVEDA